MIALRAEIAWEKLMQPDEPTARRAALAAALPARARAVPVEPPSTSALSLHARYIAAGAPVLLQGAAAAWGALQHGGALSDHLAAAYGEAPVSVSLAGGGGGYGAGRRATMPLAAYLADTALGYATDFHFARAFPRQAEYAVPRCVADDWLNNACDDDGTDDFRFLYCGPPGTWTPLHHDVLCSASWSANVAGEKLWVLVAPGDAAASLYDARGALRGGVQLSAPERKSVEAALALPAPLPGGDTRAAGSPAPPLWLALQAPGELMFVPPGWHHEVFNVGAAPLVVSINHNFFCGGALPAVWRFLRAEAAAVRAALADLRPQMGERDWHAQCRLLLRANNSGYDLPRFGALVAARALQLAAQLAGDAPGCDAADAAWRARGSACAPLRVLDAPAQPLPRRVARASLRAARRVLAELAADEGMAGVALRHRRRRGRPAAAGGSGGGGDSGGGRVDGGDGGNGGGGDGGGDDGDGGGAIIDLRELMVLLQAAAPGEEEEDKEEETEETATAEPCTKKKKKRQATRLYKPL